MLQPVSEAVGDLRAAWRGRRIAMAFAHEDVADAYRKTSLGPIWMLISYLLFNCAIVFVAGHPADIPNYIGFVACGLLVFQFMSEVISDGVTLFHREQPYIKGTTLPISIYVFRLTCRSMLRNAYPLAGAVGLLLYSGEIPNVAWLYAIAGIVLIILATPAVVTVAAIIGALSPDMGFVVQNVLRLSFFLLSSLLGQDRRSHSRDLLSLEPVHLLYQHRTHTDPKGLSGCVRLACCDSDYAGVLADRNSVARPVP